MQHWKLIVSLTILSGCVHSMPKAPEMTRCGYLGDSFYCIDPAGNRMPPVKFDVAPKMECFPYSDWEARKNWEQAVSR